MQAGTYCSDADMYATLNSKAFKTQFLEMPLREVIDYMYINKSKLDVSLCAKCNKAQTVRCFFKTEISLSSFDLN